MAGVREDILMSDRPIIFLSYRRADTDALAGRIRDRIVSQLPEHAVFLDVNSIDAGAVFTKVIETKIRESSVVLVLIGKKWMGDDNLRIHQPDDLVRLEIETAFKHKIRVVPVLVNDMRMPHPRDLPNSIAELTTRNAVELRVSRFDDDFAHLAHAITGKALPQHSRFWFNSLARVTKGVLLGLLVAQIGLIVHFHTTGKALSERIGTDGSLLIYPAAAVAGIFIMHWLRQRPRA